MGVIRHADAGYDEAIRTADAHGIAIPRRRRESP
jgi:urocanate hydratase